MEKKRYILRVILMIVMISLFAITFTGCGGDEAPVSDGETTKLSFKAASAYEDLKKLDGTTVSIDGYMATSSPVDGSFMFLMNLPYQNCPFCVPNTSQLSNTMEVYPKDGESFDYTAQAINIVGKLVVAEKEDEPFTDMYGYEFNYKIVDAAYTIIDTSELSADMALWQKIAESNVINEVYKMYDYVNFLCAWNTYTVESYTDENGKNVPGYYLYPADAENYLYTEGAQFNYGYQDGYFDGIVAQIEAVDEDAFSDLVANVRKAEVLAEKGLRELENKNYTSKLQYIEKFDNEDYVFTLNKGEELTGEMEQIYQEFSNWLGSWEM